MLSLRDIQNKLIRHKRQQSFIAPRFNTLNTLASSTDVVDVSKKLVTTSFSPNNPLPRLVNSKTEAKDERNIIKTILNIEESTLMEFEKVVFSSIVTAVDFFEPERDILGTPIFKMRCVGDIVAAVKESGGQQHLLQDVVQILRELSGTVPLNSYIRGPNNVVSNNLVSVLFLVASLSNSYPHGAADDVVSYIRNLYQGTKQMDMFGFFIETLVRCKTWPHRFLDPIGVFMGSTDGMCLSMVTILEKGSVEAGASIMHTHHRNVVQRPSIKLKIPACAFLDFDKYLDPSCATPSFYLYCAFIYRQGQQESKCCMYIIKSTRRQAVFSDLLREYFMSVRIENVTHGHMTNEGGIDAVREVERSQGMRFSLFDRSQKEMERLMEMRNVEALGQEFDVRLDHRPTWNSCLFGAFKLVGEVTSSVYNNDDIVYSTDKFGCTNVKMVTISGVFWTFSDWIECT